MKFGPQLLLVMAPSLVLSTLPVSFAFTASPRGCRRILRDSSALSSSSSMKMARTFQFVDYGSSYAPNDDDDDGERPTISCDGRIPGGVTLELTHWTGNETPDEYYADTSTEMALKLPTDVLSNAVVLNNHYDTDGVLSVFACLHPELALQYATLFKQGAEAGDFGEWSSDLGIKLDATLCAMCDGDDDAAGYDLALRELPKLLKDLSETGGSHYEHLWGPTLDRANEGWESLQDGSATIEAIQSDDDRCCVAIVREPPVPAGSLSSFALHRGLVEKGLIDTVDRVLRVTESSSSSTSFRYVYEKPGHGWVQRLVDRSPVSSVNAKQLVEHLNAEQKDGSKKTWKTGGPSGLVGICYTNELEETPDEVARCLMEQERKQHDVLTV